MSMNGARASSVASTSETSLIGASGYKASKSSKKTTKMKLKKLPAVRRPDTEMTGMDIFGRAYYSVNVSCADAKDNAAASGSSSPIPPDIADDVLPSTQSGKPHDVQLETIICKHCKKPVLKQSAKEHIAGCLKLKQEKAKKKKEAREAAARAKEKAERGDEEDDDDDDIRGSARKSATNGADGATKKSNKRKADVEDDKDGKKKKKKDEPKAKVPKPKGPVDVEKQCGVALPNGGKCARSLTCKSHSMGAKRAVPGRSLPYDMLLQAYQKKNQARQQKAAIDANAPLLFDDDLDPSLAGPVDSDEERDAVMTAISRSLAKPQPLVVHSLYPTRRKYQLVRMKEMLSNALSGNRGGSMFSISPDSARTAYPGATANDAFTLPSATVPPPSASGTSQGGTKAALRKVSVDVGG